MHRIATSLAKQSEKVVVLTYQNGFSTDELESDVALFFLQIEVMQFPKEKNLPVP